MPVQTNATVLPPASRAETWAAESIPAAPPETTVIPRPTKSRTNRAVTSLPYADAFLDHTTETETGESGKRPRTYSMKGLRGMPRNACGYSGSVSKTTRAQTDSILPKAEAASSEAKAREISEARSEGTFTAERTRKTSDGEGSKRAGP